MIRESLEPQTSSSDDTDHQPAGRGCRAHWKLNQWQIRQYRQAIDENMWYMGERLERPVAWEEAEYDFLHNGYYGCAPKWRKEYCAMRCHYFSDCELGRRFTEG